jgi:RHS repeat-associated protein
VYREFTAQIEYGQKLTIATSRSTLVSMTYDVFTNMTMRVSEAGRCQKYQYDARNVRVMKIDSTTTTTKTLYLHGLNDYPLVEKTSSGTERRYIYGASGVIAIKEGTSKRYVQKDHLGSTRVLYNESGGTESVYEYDAYGKVFGRLENTQAMYKFTGQEYETESQLHNFRARMYDDDAVIFYATDPANQTNAPYSYCVGNPVMFVDPTGRETDDEKHEREEKRRKESEAYWLASKLQMDNYLGQAEANANGGGTNSVRYLMSGPMQQAKMTRDKEHYETRFTYAWSGTDDKNMTLQSVLISYKWVPEEYGVWDYLERAKDMIVGATTAVYYEGTKTYMRLGGEGRKLIYSLNSAGAKYVQMAEKAASVAKYLEGATTALETGLLLHSSVKAYEANKTNNTVLKAEANIDLAVGSTVFGVSRAYPIAAPFATIGGISYGISKHSFAPIIANAIAKVVFPNQTVTCR